MDTRRRFLTLFRIAGDKENVMNCFVSKPEEYKFSLEFPLAASRFAQYTPRVDKKSPWYAYLMSLANWHYAIKLPRGYKGFHVVTQRSTFADQRSTYEDRTKGTETGNGLGRLFRSWRNE